MKTELLDFVWDVISEKNIKKLEMENIRYTHYKDAPGIPIDGMCNEFFFHTNEGGIFVLTIIIENNVPKQQVELSAYVASVPEEDTFRGSSIFSIDYQKYQKELETIRGFVNRSLKEIQMQIRIEQKIRLYFCTGHTLFIDTNVEESWEDIKNNKRF